jgi:hypothetical protein
MAHLRLPRSGQWRLAAARPAALESLLRQPTEACQACPAPAYLHRPPRQAGLSRPAQQPPSCSTRLSRSQRFRRRHHAPRRSVQQRVDGPRRPARRSSATQRRSRRLAGRQSSAPASSHRSATPTTAARRRRLHEPSRLHSRPPEEEEEAVLQPRLATPSSPRQNGRAASPAEGRQAQ